MTNADLKKGIDEMKLPSRSVFVIIAVILIPIATTVVSNHNEKMVRPKVVYTNMILEDAVSVALRNSRVSLPHEIPGVYNHQLITKPGPAKSVVLADPFDSQRRPQSRRLQCKTDFADGMNGDVCDVRFAGNKLKYLRLTDRRAVIYSYGPDCDDDIGRLDRAALSVWLREREYFTQPLSGLTYDPSNGTFSNGGIWRNVDLKDDPAKPH